MGYGFASCSLKSSNEMREGETDKVICGRNNKKINKEIVFK